MKSLKNWIILKLLQVYETDIGGSSEVVFDDIGEVLGGPVSSGSCDVNVTYDLLQGEFPPPKVGGLSVKIEEDEDLLTSQKPLDIESSLVRLLWHQIPTKRILKYIYICSNKGKLKILLMETKTCSLIYFCDATKMFAIHHFLSSNNIICPNLLSCDCGSSKHNTKLFVGFFLRRITCA